MHCSVMTTREPSALPILLLIHARIASAKHASRQQSMHRVSKLFTASRPSQHRELTTARPLCSKKCNRHLFQKVRNPLQLGCSAVGGLHGSRSDGWRRR